MASAPWSSSTFGCSKLSSVSPLLAASLCLYTCNDRLCEVHKHLAPAQAPSLAAGNVGNLPLVLVASLCGDAKSPIAQVMGPTCESKGLAYVAFSMWVAGETWAAAHTFALP